MTDPNDYRLFLDAVERRFGTLDAVRGVTLGVAPGEVVCLLGASGCGKSTTLRMAAGVERPSAGRVFIGGRQVAGGKAFVPPEARGVGLMFQDYALFPHLTVLENVMFGLSGLPKAEREGIAALALDRVGMMPHAKAFPSHLSGGEQQRVALARALAPRPAVLLMDEPFSGLDARLRDTVRDETLAVLKEAGAAVLLVTHDPEEAMRMADRIALMRGGRLVQVGAPEEVYNRPVDVEAAAFFSDLNVFASRVEAARAPTPFGPVPAPGLEEGQAVEVTMRPHAIRIMTGETASSLSAQATVERARLLGAESLIEVALCENAPHAGPCDCGRPIQVVAPGRYLPRRGETVRLGLDPDQVFVFPAQAM